MFESIHIKNFQAHSNLKIKFDPHVTVLTGISDKGKSAVIRAIRWVCLNQPDGVAFIKNGENKAKVTLTVDGHSVRRIRGKENTYHLDSHVLKAFRNEPPADIKELLRVSDINFQNQHDSPFWFSESSGEVSRQLNQIINLGAIDDVLGRINSKLRESNSAVFVREQSYEEARKKHKALKSIKVLDADLKRVERLESKQKETDLERTRIDDLLKSVLEHELRSESAAKAVLYGSVVLKLGLEWQKTRKELVQLQEVAEQIEEIKRTLHKKVPDISHLETVWKEIQDAIQEQSGLIDLIGVLQNQEEDHRAKVEQTQELEKQLKAAMGDKCPLCGTELKG